MENSRELKNLEQAMECLLKRAIRRGVKNTCIRMRRDYDAKLRLAKSGDAHCQEMSSKELL